MGALILVASAVLASLRPFTVTAYATVLSVAFVVLALYVARGGLTRAESADLARGDGDGRNRVWPWVAVVVLAVALEVVGLALGGHSPSVPTLSTEFDRLLRHYPLRLVAALAWATLGVAPSLRRGST